MIDDFTEENGGTRYVPGSHKLRTVPDSRRNYETVPIIGNAGSVAFLHGYTWHKTGSNNSRDGQRRALFAYYVRPFLRVQENHIVSVREEVWHRASPTLRHLLGGDLWLNSIGFFDGPPAYREAAFPRRSGLGTPPKPQSQNNASATSTAIQNRIARRRSLSSRCANRLGSLNAPELAKAIPNFMRLLLTRIPTTSVAVSDQCRAMT